MSGHRVAHDLGRTAELGGMDNGLGRAEHPLAGIAPLDPHARFVAGDNISTAQGCEGAISPGDEDRCRALEHVHQRALAEIEPQQVGKCALQAFVGKQLVRLEVEHQRMNAPAKGRTLCRLRHGRGGCLAALRPTALQSAEAFDDRLHLGKVNLVIFPDHRTRFIFSKRQTTMATVCRSVIFRRVRRLSQDTGMGLVAGLAPAGAGTFSPRFPIRRGGFDDVREVLSGRCKPSTRSINSGFVSPPELLTIHEHFESQPGRHGKLPGGRPKPCSLHSGPRPDADGNNFRPLCHSIRIRRARSRPPMDVCFLLISDWDTENQPHFRGLSMTYTLLLRPVNGTICTPIPGCPSLFAAAESRELSLENRVSKQ